MGQPPLVSVLMSVYNSERYITQAVESILNQTYREFEFVIIDDGSTDRTPTLLDAYAARDPCIHLLHRENRGIPKTCHEAQTAFDRAWARCRITTQFQATKVCGWRPSDEPGSHHEFMLKYGWWGFNNSHRETARHYGLRAIATNPLDVEGWKLLACAIAKPLPPSPSP